MRLVLLAFALAPVACSPGAVPPAKAEPPSVVVEVAEASEPEPPAAPPDPAPDCDVRYRVERIDKSTPTCTVDIPNVGSEARLECRGSSAKLSFDNRDYTGSASVNGVELDLVSNYDFTDGCLWEATAHVTGTPAFDLRLDYTERTIRGSECSNACTATASLSVMK